MRTSEALKADLLGADGPSPTFLFFLSLQHCLFTLCQASKDIRRFLNHTHTRSERHLLDLTNISTHARADTNAETQKGNAQILQKRLWLHTHVRAHTYRTIKHMCRITLEVQIYSGVCFSHLLMWSLFCRERQILRNETSESGSQGPRSEIQLRHWRIS